MIPDSPTLTPHAPPLMRISCERYHAMIERGMLTPDDRVELINGYLVTKLSIGPSHSSIRTKLEKILDRLLGNCAWVRGQEPITIHDYSEPEPDVAVVKYRDDAYAQRHPYPEDVCFVVEVADSSLAYDRETKIPLYAACGIPEAWLVDVTSRTIVVFSQPDGAAYSREQAYQAAARVPLPGFSGLTVSGNEIGL